jgi:hypothetical protein
VEGISFSGSGTFTALGNQNITLFGSGTPTSTTPKKLTLTSDSQGSVITSCTINVVIVIPVKRLLTIGSSPNVFGYNFSGTAASNKLITTASNFGTLVNSIVKSDGYTIIDGGNTLSAREEQSLLGSDPVDILVIGYSWTMNEAEADIITNYILKGGVVLAYCESPIGMRRLFRNIFNDNQITTSGGLNAAGALYRLPVTNNEILNGPFGDVRGLLWGEDASGTCGALGLPTGDIDIYSYGDDLSGSTVTPATAPTYITAFKHKTMNFIWFGDGGFNSNNGGTSNTVSPFLLNGNNFPVFHPAYGRGTVAANHKNVYNSIITANIFAWAIKQAEFNGINTP